MAATLAKFSLDHELPEVSAARACAPLLAMAMAYDLSGDQWDEPFRLTIASLLRRRSDFVAAIWDVNDRNANDRMARPPWLAILRGTGGVCALAAMGDPTGSADDPPIVLQTASQPKGYVPGRGVPVIPFEEGMSVPSWLYAAPFPLLRDLPFAPTTRRSEYDHLAAIGGRAAATPSLGTQIYTDQFVRTFERLPQHLLKSYNGKPEVDVERRP